VEPALAENSLIAGQLAGNMIAATLRRLGIMVRVGCILFIAGTAACAEQRSSGGDDSTAARRATDTPDAKFRAHLGRTWELVRLGDQDIGATHASPASRPPTRYPGPGIRPTIRFTAEPATALWGDSTRLSVAGGRSFCNGYGTAYELGPGDQLRFHGGQSTLVGCDGPDSPETRYFRALHETRRFELDSMKLSLIAADGSRLVFVAAPDSTSAPAG
jgi:heat shock protein HslJ